MAIESIQRKKFRLGIAVQLVFVLLVLILHYGSKQCSVNRDDAKLREIKVELARIRKPTTFKEVGETYTSRSVDAAAFKFYRSDMDFGSVKGYFNSELNRLGWQISEETEPPYYQKNDFRLYIEYRRDQTQWNYSLSIVWKNADNKS